MNMLIDLLRSCYVKDSNLPVLNQTPLVTAAQVGSFCILNLDSF